MPKDFSQAGGSASARRVAIYAATVRADEAEANAIEAAIRVTGPDANYYAFCADAIDLRAVAADLRADVAELRAADAELRAAAPSVADLPSYTAAFGADASALRADAADLRLEAASLRAAANVLRSCGTMTSPPDTSHAMTASASKEVSHIQPVEDNLSGESSSSFAQ